MIFANPDISVFVIVADPDDRMVRLQTEQESGEFAGVVYGRFRCSGSKLLESLAQACPFHFAYGGGSCPRRDIGASAVDQQLAELFDGRYRHRAGNGYLDQYDGAGLETEPSGSIQRCGVRFHQRPSER